MALEAYEREQARARAAIGRLFSEAVREGPKHHKWLGVYVVRNTRTGEASVWQYFQEFAAAYGAGGYTVAIYRQTHCVRFRDSGAVVWMLSQEAPVERLMGIPVHARAYAANTAPSMEFEVNMRAARTRARWIDEPVSVPATRRCRDFLRRLLRRARAAMRRKP